MSDTRYTKDHEYIRVDGDVGDRRHHRPCAEPARRRRLRRTAGGRQEARTRATRPRWSRASRRRARSSAPAVRRGRRGQCRARERARRHQRGPQGEGWFFKLKLADPAELDALMDEAAYSDFLKTIALSDSMRYLPLDADRPRATCWRASASPTSTRCSPTFPPASASRRCSTCRRAKSEIEVERMLGAHGRHATSRPARCRSSSAAAPTAPRAGERRSSDPALRVPDHLHALSARDRAGHAASICSSSRRRSPR